MPEDSHQGIDAEEGVLRAALETQDQVVLAFRADWSDRCRELETELDRIESESIFIVDVDDNPMLAYEYDVTRIPTLVRIENQEVVDRTEGVPEDVGTFFGTELVH